jgi:hypothetical protein
MPVEPTDQDKDDEVLEDREHEQDFVTLAAYLGERAAAIWERIRPPPLD